MKSVLINKYYAILTRRRALRSYIEPILMLGSQAISKQLKEKLLLE